MSAERLQKVLAAAGIASRRDCEELITAGRVIVNGNVMHTLGARVDPENDEIMVDGAPIKKLQPRSYVLLNKPTGVISTAEDTHNRPTVVEMVSSDTRLFPIGRLDQDSEGLILLTDDGALTQRLTHPSYNVEKEYRALLDRAPDADALRDWRDGVELDGEMTAPAWVEVQERTDDGVWVRIVLQEGRKRQIREVANLLGYEVRRLIRVREGSLTLGDLALGQWRTLTDGEIDALWQHVGGRPSEEQAEASASDDRAPRRRRTIATLGAFTAARSDQGSDDERPRNDAPNGRPARSSEDRPRRDFNDRPPRDSFNRDDRPQRDFNDRPPRDSFNRDDRPQRDFNDRPRTGGFNDRPPRDSFNRDDRPRRNFNDRPPRDNSNRDDRPRTGGFNRDDRPRRDFNDRPPRDSFNRDDRPRTGEFNRDDRPRTGEFNRDDRPRRDFNVRPPRDSFNRDDRPRPGGFNRDDRPRTGGYSDRPRTGGFNRDDRPRTGGYSDRPRTGGFNRDDRPRTGGYSDRPRTGGFNRDDRPRTGGYSDRPRPGGFNRDDRPRTGGYSDRPRTGGFNRDDRPRTGGYSDRPRTGGFNRDDRPQRDFNDRPPREFNDRPRTGGFNRDDRPQSGGFGRPPARDGRPNRSPVRGDRSLTPRGRVDRNPAPRPPRDIPPRREDDE